MIQYFNNTTNNRTTQNHAHRLSPLHLAAMSGNEECVTLLLSHGANTTVRDARGRLPVDVAHPNVVHLLKLNPSAHIPKNTIPQPNIRNDTIKPSDPMDFTEVCIDNNQSDHHQYQGHIYNPSSQDEEEEQVLVHHSYETVASSSGDFPISELGANVISRVQALFDDFAFPHPEHLASELYGFLYLARRNSARFLVPGRVMREAIDLLVTMNPSLAHELEEAVIEDVGNGEIRDMILWRIIKHQELIEMCSELRK